jgi:hypothetical protein
MAKNTRHPLPFPQTKDDKNTFPVGLYDRSTGQFIACDPALAPNIKGLNPDELFVLSVNKHGLITMMTSTGYEPHEIHLRISQFTHVPDASTEEIVDNLQARIIQLETGLMQLMTLIGEATPANLLKALKLILVGEDDENSGQAVP